MTGWLEMSIRLGITRTNAALIFHESLVVLYAGPVLEAARLLRFYRTRFQGTAITIDNIEEKLRVGMRDFNVARRKRGQSPDGYGPNTADELIANMEETDQCKGNWLKVVVDAGGKYTITNGRNGFSKSYLAR